MVWINRTRLTVMHVDALLAYIQVCVMGYHNRKLYTLIE